MPDDFLLAIPVFNEEKHLLSVLAQVRGRAENVLVIDDGSTDATPTLLKRVPDIHVISHPENRGYGKSLADAFCFAQRRGFSWLITMDCDEQHEPSRIGAFLRAAAEDDADFISGTRYPHGWDRAGVAPAERREINRQVTTMLNRRLGLHLTDAFCGFKAYRVSSLSHFSITVPGYAMPIQLWVQAARAGLRIRELPVRLIYNDPTRHFGGLLDDPNVRLQHYQEVMERELNEPAASAEILRECAPPPAMLDYKQLVAPARHGGVLVAPDPTGCAAAARQNGERLNACSATIHGSSLGSWRAATRARHLAGSNQTVVMVGHQPDFIHAGVWAKNVAAYRLAQALQAVAVHLVVDSDAPKRLSLRVPAEQEDRIVVREIRAGTVFTGFPYEQIAATSPAEIEHFRDELRAVTGERYSASALPLFLEGFGESSASDWVSQVIAGRRKVESEFDVELHNLRLRDAWWSPLAAHLLLDAAGFAHAYNESLAEYRVRNKVRSSTRPIPDLVIDADRCEAPFWAYGPGEPRRRVFLAADADHVTLCAESSPLVTLSREQIESSDDVIELIRRESGWLIRPRALITTIWARLFLADLFIHGIGGAKYDRISDGIIARYFGIPAPEIACVTATLTLFPECGAEWNESCIEWELRDATWNPQRHFSCPTTPELERLIQEKGAVVQQSEELRRTAPQDHKERRKAYQHIHRLSAEIQSHCPAIVDRPHSVLELLRRTRAGVRAARDREYFFALHSRENLQLLLDALPGVADFV